MACILEKSVADKFHYPLSNNVYLLWHIWHILWLPLCLMRYILFPFAKFNLKTIANIRQQRDIIQCFHKLNAYIENRNTPSKQNESHRFCKEEQCFILRARMAFWPTPLIRNAYLVYFLLSLHVNYVSYDAYYLDIFKELTRPIYLHKKKLIWL